MRKKHNAASGTGSDRGVVGGVCVGEWAARTRLIAERSGKPNGRDSGFELLDGQLNRFSSLVRGHLDLLLLCWRQLDADDFVLVFRHWMLVS